MRTKMPSAERVARRTRIFVSVTDTGAWRCCPRATLMQAPQDAACKQMGRFWPSIRFVRVDASTDATHSLTTCREMSPSRRSTKESALALLSVSVWYSAQVHAQLGAAVLVHVRGHASAHDHLGAGLALWRAPRDKQSGKPRNNSRVRYDQRQLIVTHERAGVCRFSAYVGVPHSQGTGSGTSELHEPRARACTCPCDEREPLL
jgi:hypothetical protein